MTMFNLYKVTTKDGKVFHVVAESFSAASEAAFRRERGMGYKPTRSMEEVEGDVFVIKDGQKVE